MKEIVEYLALTPVPMPSWLNSIESMANSEVLRSFLSSKMAFYPGSGFDGQAIRVFGSSHACHCFVYADYLLTQERLITSISEPNAFKGYRSVKRCFYDAENFKPKKPMPEGAETPWVKSVNPYCFVEILQREEHLTESHGPFRLAIFFAGFDAYDCFRALFCERMATAELFAVLLQDHGFGGNYSKFGKGGLMEQLALDAEVEPRYLLVGPTTNPWHNYEICQSLLVATVGKHPQARVLYERTKEEYPSMETCFGSHSRVSKLINIG